MSRVTTVSASSAWPGLVGRRTESRALGDLVTAARAGHSAVLVLRGAAGVGKTALLEHLVRRTTGCQVARAAGVETERDLPFAGLHQLCGPFLDRLDTLPSPQRDALGTVFGRRPGAAPDRFLVGLAVLTLLSAVADEQPLLCVVDDAQWLGRASAEVLEFVARRLAAEPLALVISVRDGDGDGAVFDGLPGRRLHGLRLADAAVLLDRTVTGTLDPRVRDRIVAESRGNPLTLLELPRALPAAELAFGGGGGGGGRDGDEGDGPPERHHLEQSVRGQVQLLPAPARRLLLVAAAEPVGDVALLRRAADHLGLGADAVAAAEAAGLVEVRELVRFRHPLVRCVVYRAAAHADRRTVHRALADATDADRDPDRRAWHLAHAAIGPDDAVADDLEHAADRALASGGLAAAAALLDWSATLTPEPARRARRTLAAAQAQVAAGSFDDAATLLAAARVGPLDDAGRARLDLVQAQLGSAEHSGAGALRLLLAAARRLEPIDPVLARDTRLDAFAAALVAGRPGGQAGGRARERWRRPCGRHRRRRCRASATCCSRGWPCSVPTSPPR